MRPSYRGDPPFMRLASGGALLQIVGMAAAIAGIASLIGLLVPDDPDLADVFFAAGGVTAAAAGSIVLLAADQRRRLVFLTSRRTAELEDFTEFLRFRTRTDPQWSGEERATRMSQFLEHAESLVRRSDDDLRVLLHLGAYEEASRLQDASTKLAGLVPWTYWGAEDEPER